MKDKIIIEFSKSEVARLPRVTKSNKVMRAKKGRGSYKWDKRNFRNEAAGDSRLFYWLVNFSLDRI